MQKYDKHSVTDFLKENGMASGLKARRELFHELIGRETYTGAAEQNILLLRTLKQRLAIEKKTKDALRTEQSEVGMGILKRTMDIPQIIDASPTQPLALPTEKDSMHESMEASALLRKIDYVNIASLNTNDIHGTLISLKKLQEEGRVSLDEIQKRLIPPTEYVLGMFYSDRFVEQELPHLESRANVPAGHPYRQSVARIQKAVPHARMVRDRYHALIAEYIKVFGDASHDFTSIASLFPAGVASMPSHSELSNNHQDAIDIFFQSRRNGMEEIGPEIRAMNGGIVLAAAGDWRGGAGIESYQSGGIAPKVGNGVIIFNPQTEEYSEYAHLSSVAVQTGDIISAGTVIGKGGNTGANARRSGHGNHVHFEIHKKDNNQHIAMTPRSIAERIRGRA